MMNELSGSNHVSNPEFLKTDLVCYGLAPNTLDPGRLLEREVL